MIEKQQVETMLSEYFQFHPDLFLVDLRITPSNQIVVEMDSKQGVSIDDCAQMSEWIELRLDREKEDFELEVSSPGLGSPFKVRQQYEKYLGEEVEVTTKVGEKWSGILDHLDQETFSVRVTEKIKPEGAKRSKMVERLKSFTFDEIKKTTYLIRFK
ncbi:MAG: ribosome assembly cofactor RimP [Microbacter sp.]